MFCRIFECNYLPDFNRPLTNNFDSKELWKIKVANYKIPIFKWNLIGFSTEIPYSKISI
jgi:hypothetical protein